jgi:ubiquinone/menaquinone biosynthesis C-methylase UbiE
MINKEFSKLYCFCRKYLKQYESWPSYFYRRYVGFLSYYDIMPQNHYEEVLDLGCSIGYNSAFLSKISDHVVASDLEQENPSTHTPGLQKTREFLSLLGIENVIVQHADAEDLPFEDNRFDMVFSSHVLEHVLNPGKAVREIYRVLKPGGIHFCVVPTSTYCIYGFLHYYVYLIKRSIVHIWIRLFKKKQNTTSYRQVFNSNHKYPALKHFPYPPPHGANSHFMDELRNWTISKWQRLITQNGSYKLLHQSSTELNPLRPLADMIYPSLGVAIHAVTRGLEAKVGANVLLKHMGINAVIITKKNA